jgi:hypothetical protein
VLTQLRCYLYVRDPPLFAHDATRTLA